MNEVEEWNWAVLELFRFLIGVGERFRHADAGDGTLQRGVDHGDALAALGERLAHLLAEDERHGDQYGHAGENDERERDADGAQVDERPDDHDAADEDVLRPMVRQLAHVHEVVGHARHDLAGLVVVEEGVGERLQLVEHVGTHLRLHPHAHYVAVVLHVVAHQHAEDIQRHQRDAVDHQELELPVRDEVIQHAAREDGIHHADDRDDQRGQHIQHEDLPVGLIVGDEALQQGETPSFCKHKSTGQARFAAPHPTCSFASHSCFTGGGSASARRL